MTLFGRLLGRGDLHSLAAPYALDALDPDERARFERHLESCDRCTAEVRDLAEDTVRLAWSTAVPAPDALRERVLSAIHGIPQEPAPQRSGSARGAQLPPYVWGTQPPPRPRQRRPVLLVPLATVTSAAALVVAALFGVQAERTQDELRAERDRAREIAHVLSAPDARASTGRDGRGRTIGVIASASEESAIVTLGGYGEPPRGRVHQLWLMRPGAQPRSLGLFEGDTPLVATGLEPSGTSLAVTVEPDGGSPQPTSRPIAQLALKTVGFGE
ncbi:anti-sigma factor [Streptomyces sp. SBST2-5]|uniref:Regulator of SigK n=1 Tax=Streptomyces composti TaxID=2720025 RepID=A0ABX1AFZ8_9ACTN|nr:anti-sigma factor [Streptomyces composti]NJP52508.1 anti-sigma factor [Streptomyces composti]